VACRSQNNPRSTSSDGVPPEFEVLGLREALLVTRLTGWRYRSDRSTQDFVTVDRFDDRSHVLLHSSVFGAILCQHSENIVHSPSCNVELAEKLHGS